MIELPRILFNNNMGYIETPEPYRPERNNEGLITIWDILKLTASYSISTFFTGLITIWDILKRRKKNVVSGPVEV